jgi:phosphonate transport system substrate-binding protein
MTFLRSLIAGAVALACVAAHAEDLNLGIISTDSSSVLSQRWQPLVDEQANRPARQSLFRH